MSDAHRPMVGMVHATIKAVDPMRVAFARRLPQVQVLHFLDDGLLSEENRLGRITPTLVRRLATVITLAVEARVAIVLLTCTVYTPVVPDLQRLFELELLPVDRMLSQEGARSGPRVGLLVTNPGTLESSSQAILQAAAEQKRQVHLETRLYPEAYTALDHGDVARHDAILLKALAELAPSVDSIVLAQASMSSVEQAQGFSDATGGKPVLSSPSLCVDLVRRKLNLAENRAQKAGFE